MGDPKEVVVRGLKKVKIRRMRRVRRKSVNTYAISSKVTRIIRDLRNFKEKPQGIPEPSNLSYMESLSRSTSWKRARKPSVIRQRSKDANWVPPDEFDEIMGGFHRI